MHGPQTAFQEKVDSLRSFPVSVGKLFPFHYDLAFSAIALTDTGNVVTEAALAVCITPDLASHWWSGERNPSQVQQVSPGVS